MTDERTGENVVRRLQEWQAAKFRSEGEAWNGQERFRLMEFENPGWGIRSVLVDTNLANDERPAVRIERSDDDWVIWKVTKGVFEGGCGSHNLEELLTIFLDYVWDATLE